MTESGVSALDRDGSVPPLVSVVIPMRNEEATIGACLQAILRQQYPPERMEVIVVDGESDDGSRDIVRQIADCEPRIRLMSNPRRIVPAAMNIGIRAARGEVIARVDGHTELPPRYLWDGVEALRRTGADNVGGPMLCRGGGGFGDGVACAMSSRFGIGAYFHFGTVERKVDTVYLGMWPRRVFREVGLFDEELVRNQDDELNYRIRKCGGTILLVPSMGCSYQNRQSVKSLARQFFQYGVWKVRVLQKHPRQMSLRHFVPPAFMLLVVGTLLFGLCVPALQLTGLALLSLYATVLIGAAGSAAGRDVRVWGATILAFLLIHQCWGAGFLVGLVRFRERWGRTEPAPERLDGEREPPPVVRVGT